MDQTPQNIVRLQSSRSYNANQALTPLYHAGAAALIGVRILVFVAHGGSSAPLIALCVGLLMEFGAAYLVIRTLKSPRVRQIQGPDVLEFSPDRFHYVSPIHQKDISVPWSQVSADLRFADQKPSLLVEVSGQPLLWIEDGQFGRSIKGMLELISSMSRGRSVTPAALCADKTPPGTLDFLKGGLIVLAVLAPVVLVMWLRSG